MMTASSRIWTFAAVIVIIIAIALGWFLGAAPLLSDAARFDSERRDVALQNDATRVAIAQLEGDFERIDEFEAELDSLRLEFPERPDYGPAAEEFFRELVSAGLVLTSLTISEPSPADPEVGADEAGQVDRGTLLELPVSISVTGALSDTLVFIDRIQRSSRFTVIDSFTVSEGGTPEESVVIAVRLFMVSGKPAAIAATGTGGDGEDQPVGDQPTDEDS